jgi:cell division initiation protein
MTPIDVSHKTFNKKMFGLDEMEVMEFLQIVASHMEEMIHERNVLREALREKDTRIAEFRERDQILQSTISTAGTMSEKIRSDADREAKLILADAQQKAEIVTRDSRDSLKRIYQEIADLKRVRMQFEANLRALAQAHMSLLEQGEKYMPNIGLGGVSFENSSANHQNNNQGSRSSDISPLSSHP